MNNKRHHLKAAQLEITVHQTQLAEMWLMQKHQALKTNNVFVV